MSILVDSIACNTKTTGVAILATVLLSAGCSTGGPVQMTFDRHEDVGTVMISPVSVDSWDSYVEALQPKFELTPKEALERAIPTTLRFEEQIVDALSTAFKLAPPTSKTASTRERAVKDGTESRSFTRTTERGPGDVSGIEFEDTDFGGASNLPRSPEDTRKSIDMDPMLQYRVAAALYQEVKLLNRYIKSAVVDRRKYEAYVVRFQATLMPNVRRAPYDAHLNVSFFTEGEAPSPGHTSAASGRDGIVDSVQGGGGAIPTSPTYVPTIKPDSSANGSESAEAGGEPIDGADSDVVPSVRVSSAAKVIPLLVTDSVEQTGTSTSLDRVRQHAIALTALVHGFGASADIQRLDESLQSAFGHDINSLLTLGKVSDNTLAVRFGARAQPRLGNTGKERKTEYVMVPQAHSVTTLVLVPKGQDFVRMIGKTIYTHVETGQVPVRRSIESLEKLSTDFAAKYGGLLKLHTSPSETWNLLTIVQRNEFDQFKDGINNLAYPSMTDDDGKVHGENPGEQAVVDKISGSVAKKNGGQKANMPYEQIWMDLVSILRGSQFSSASFELPTKESKTLVLPPEQLGALDDDGGEQAVVAVYAGANMDANNLQARLELAEPEVHLYAYRVEVFDNKRAVRAHFRSLKSLSIEVDKVSALKLCHGEKDCRSYKLRASAPAKPLQFPKSLTLDVTGANIHAKQDATGDLAIRLTVGKVPDPIGVGNVSRSIHFSLRGADVRGIAPADVLVPDAGGWSVAKTGTVVLTLANLDPRTPVVLSARERIKYEKDGDTQQVELEHGPTSLDVVNVDYRRKP